MITLVGSSLLLLAWLTPLLLLPLCHHRASPWLLLVAPLPALIAAVLPGQISLDLPWLLLGSRLGLDELSQPLLLVTSLLWLAASLYARDSLREDAAAGRFRLFFLLAMAGNLLLIVAQEMLTFYLGFALMGLAAAGLVGHRGEVSARRAGRHYLVWTVAGELLLFSGILLVVFAADGTLFNDLALVALPDLAVALLLLGFGIKVALPGLHLWLPLAYPAIPIAGAVVLAGAMIKAGLLGLLRFLPSSATISLDWGSLLILLGVFGSLAGVAIGLLQRTPRVVLAYSSISQMGVMMAAFGVSLMQPPLAPVVLPALLIYALHHALTKGALFMGVGLLERARARRWILLGLLLLALVLAGAPLTSGAVAKYALKSALPETLEWLAISLLIGSVGTTLLMARFLALAWSHPSAPPQSARFAFAGWLLLLVAILLLPLFVGQLGLLSGALPLLLAIAVALLIGRFPGILRSWVGAIPPGDLLALAPWVEAMAKRLTARPSRLRLPRPPHLPLSSGADWDARLLSWPLAGALWSLILLAMLLLILLAVALNGGTAS